MKEARVCRGIPKRRVQRALHRAPLADAPRPADRLGDALARVPLASVPQRDRAEGAQAAANLFAQRPDLELLRRQAAEESIQAAQSAFRANRFATALEFYQEALRLGADPDQHATERWTCLMQLGLFEAAWQETDRTEKKRRAAQQRTDHLPPHLRRVWDGRPLSGKRVLVRCYHGLGDTIQFARYLYPLSKAVRTLSVEAQPSLMPLLEVFPETCRYPSNDQRNFDAEIELMELAYFFRTSLENIPADTPYLRVPPDLAKSRYAELAQLGLSRDALNVGLVWVSGDWNPDRDIHLSDLQCLSEISGVRLFSLQRGAAMLQAQELRPDCHIIPTERDSGTPLDTAAAILHLDLVISVDTMVAHLAGALGKPVWTLLPYRSDWRWMADREDTPWYPTMRLFRQSRPGHWSDVVARVRSELLRVCRRQPAATQTSSGSISCF